MRFRKGHEILAGSIIFGLLFVTAVNYYFGGTVRGHGWIFGTNFGVTSTSLNNDLPEITVVTFYTNIGTFQKGTGSLYYTPNNYKTWMTSWGLLTNRVVGFFTEDDTLNYFRKIRSSQPADRTVLLKIDRTELPAFSHLEKVRQIFQSPGYPRHPPNTVSAEYACAMHAKYDVIQMALSRGLVHTKFIAWLDIGLFRHLSINGSHYTGDPITLEVPENFNSSSIGMSEVTRRQDLANTSPRDFIYNNIVWVGGAFSLGTRKTMWTFSESYKSTMKQLLEQNLTSTDQQNIGAMYSPEFIKHQKVDMMANSCSDGQFGLYSYDNQYFCFAYACKDVGDRRRETHFTRNV